MANRYFLNADQRHIIIHESALIDAQMLDKTYEELYSELQTYDNRDLVDRFCGEDWEGFIGQTTNLA